MEIASFLLILGSVAGGVAAAVAATWNLRLRLFRLESAVVDLQQKHLANQNKTAAKVRWDKDAILAEARELVSAVKPQARNPWDL